MKRHDNPNASFPPDVPPQDVIVWNDHEHVSEQIQLEAAKLIDQAGSIELAKKAIEAVGQDQPAWSPSDSNAVESIETTTITPFDKALAELEKSLQIPVVSGEVQDWVAAVKQSLDHVGAMLQDEVKTRHTELFKQIIREDPELSSQVEKLQTTDEQLVLIEYECVRLNVEKLLASAQAVGNHESKISESTSATVKQALSFVISARTQEVAIATWLTEAFNRDRGVGD